LSRIDDEESRIDASKRLTAKERVANLKKQLELKKKMLRGEIEDPTKHEEEKEQDDDNAADTSIQIDTSKQEKELE
jgi:RNA polymerase-binding transcription factor DksA